MKLLAIDTATEACSVAIWLDGQIIETYEVAGREHSARLPLMVPSLLSKAGLVFSQLDGLVCGVGPGSFAGVRIGVSYVKGLALGLDLPVVGVTSLAMLAQRVIAKAPSYTVMAAIDARMNEVYFGVYKSVGGLAARLQADCVCAPSAVHVDAAVPLIGVGTGWQVYGGELEARLAIAPEQIDASALPHAQDALPLAASDFTAGRATDASALIPVYLRNRVALTKLEQAEFRAKVAASKA